MGAPAPQRRGRSRVTSADGWLEFGGELKRTFSGYAAGSGGGSGGGRGGGRAGIQRRGVTSYEVPRRSRSSLGPESEVGDGEHVALARSLEAISGH